MGDIANRMHLAEPVARDKVERPPQVPETVMAAQKEIAEERMKEWEEQSQLYFDMDPDYTGIDQRKRYLLENPEWRFDKIPEFLDGKNVADFWSNDLEEKLALIEREELVRLRKLEAEALELAEGQYELTPEQAEKVARIREKKAMIILESRKTKTSGTTPLPRTSAARASSRNLDEFASHLSSLGLNGEAVADSLRSRSRSRSRSMSRGESTSRVGRKRSRSEYERSLSTTPGEGRSFSDSRQRLKAQKLDRDSTKELNRDGRRGTSDRHVYDWKPKHLYSGKTGFSRERR